MRILKKRKATTSQVEMSWHLWILDVVGYTNLLLRWQRRGLLIFSSSLLVSVRCGLTFLLGGGSALAVEGGFLFCLLVNTLITNWLNTKKCVNTCLVFFFFFKLPPTQTSCKYDGKYINTMTSPKVRQTWLFWSAEQAGKRETRDHFPHWGSSPSDRQSAPLCNPNPSSSSPL